MATEGSPKLSGALQLPVLSLGTASQVTLVVKNQPTNAGDIADARLISGLG